jgi:hypothetical protein
VRKLVKKNIGCVRSVESDKYKINSKERYKEKLSNIRLGRKPMMPYNLAELVTYCLMMERKYFEPTTKSIKRMAFELAIEIVLPVHF